MSTVTIAQVLTLFGLFGGDVITVDEALAVPRLLDEVMLALGQDPRAWISQITTTDTGTEVDHGDGENYELRADLNIIRLLGVFVDDRQLMRERSVAMSAEWRDHVGAPVAYCTDGKSDRLLRFFPRPDRTATSETFDKLHGAPTVLYTERRTGGIPAQLALPLALLTLAREFERESAHRDQDFSGICTALANNFLTLLQQGEM